MDNPVTEIQGVIRGLVERPTFQRQADVIGKYFTEDAEFKHPYVNVAPSVGRKGVIALYNYGEIIVNYQHVEFKKIAYDPTADILDIEILVLVRPWIQLWRPTTLRLNTILYLKDVEDKFLGKTVKQIKSQRDYFIRSPIVQLIPVIGAIYDSDKLRYFGGKVLTISLYGFVNAYRKFAPSKVQEVVYNFWEEHLAIPPPFLKPHTA